MAAPVIPAMLSKGHVLEIQRNIELTIGWSGWNPTYSNADRRKLIVKRLSECSFCVNTFPVKESALVAFDVDDQDDFESDAVVSGICFVRAFYDNTINTGKIYTGQSVVYDSVTGKCVTGINSSWVASEYKIIGTSLVDYEELTADGEDIPIEIGSRVAPIAPKQGAEIISFRIISMGPFIGDSAACDIVLAEVTRINCGGSSAKVGDTVWIYDPSASYFNAPMRVLINAHGTALLTQWEEDDGIAECFVDPNTHGDVNQCYWAVLSLSCCVEDIHDYTP